tara:strand:- start:760 stop:927 length:168 start_codon:yes stop_codon:yes gene_type:complete
MGFFSYLRPKIALFEELASHVAMSILTQIIGFLFFLVHFWLFAKGSCFQPEKGFR